MPILFVAYKILIGYKIAGVQYIDEEFEHMYLEGFLEPWDDDEMALVIDEITKFKKATVGDSATFSISVINFKGKVVKN